MNPIYQLFPAWGVKRQRAMDQLRAYEAAKPTRTHEPRRSKRRPDDLVGFGGRSLKEQARWLDENHDIAVGILDILVRNIVGTGLDPEPMVRDQAGDLATEINDALTELWEDWIKAPEVTGEFDYGSAQRLKCRTWFRDGEVLTQYLAGKVPGLDHGTRVPFSVELFEADVLPLDFNDKAKRITQGVQKDRWGRPTYYWIDADPDAGGYRRNYKGVPAHQVAHLKIARRFQQTRGVSVFAPIIIRLADIKDWEDSERVAARIAAAVVGVITKGSPDIYDTDKVSSAKRNLEFNPGTILDDLEQGEGLELLNPSRPNPNVGKFRDDQIRAAAGGAGVSFSSASKNYNGTYSAQRQELSEQDPQYAILWSEFVARSEKPTWKRFVETCIAAGLVDIGGVDINTLYDSKWSRPVMPWIDPYKETRSDTEAANGLVDTLEDIWRRRGKKPREMWAKLKEQAEKLENIGLRPGDPPQPMNEKEEDNKD